MADPVSEPHEQGDARGRSNRFDLGPLEFGVVRDLLLGKLTTPLGRREVLQLLPHHSADEVRRALAEVAEIAARLQAGEPVPLAGVVEVRGWLEPFFAGEHQPSTRDLADLKRLLRATLRCREWLRAGAPHPHLAAWGEDLPDVLDLAEELDLIVDARGEVLSTASVKLGEIRAAIDAAELAVRAAVQRFLSDVAVHRCLQSPEPAWRHGRPVFAVRQEHRERISGVLHDRSQSGATLFIEPSVVVDAANQLSDARAAEHREIQVVLAHVCRGLNLCRDTIEAAVRALARLDVRCACARLVHEEGFSIPTVVDGGPLRLVRARHPILLSKTDREIVPLDVRLGDPHALLVITGPNTGGKTVVLKTIGLLALMAVCGVPVPAATGTQIPFFDGVFADIGDEQTITQNLSTFSSHISRIARCLDLATEHSLVLLDELGAGTDPEEGGALGYAVLELLEQRGTLGVVTTHLGQLKQFAYRHGGAENGSMAFDGRTLRPLYRLDTGVPGQSHALDIAGQVGMPASVVQRARERIGKRDVAMQEALEQVQRTRRLAETDRQATERLRGQVESDSRQLTERLQQLERRHLWLHEEADALVDEQLRSAREAVVAAVKGMQNAPKPFGDRARQLADELTRLLRQTSVHRRRMQFIGELRRDAVVYVPRLGRSCVVKRIDRTRETCTIEVGKMRLDVPFDDVSWLQPLDGKS
jgi:DNA mismatch repair protein MutS2